MSEFIGFDSLNVGQKVKMKGKPSTNNTFVAIEITLKESDGWAKIEGAIQGVDLQKNTLRLFDQDFALPSGIVVRDVQRNFIGLENLKAGSMVKFKGKYSASTGWLPVKINMKEIMGFAVEELHGRIDRIDGKMKTLEVAGFTVLVNKKTVIEGF